MSTKQEPQTPMCGYRTDARHEHFTCALHQGHTGEHKSRMELLATPAVSPDVPQVVLLEIIEERRRQDKQWGGPKHDDEHSANDWRDFLREHIKKSCSGDYRYQMIRVAALAIAAIESHDRLRAAPVEASPSAGAQDQRELRCGEWLHEHIAGFMPSVDWAMSKALREFVNNEAAASPDVLARIDGLITMWKERDVATDNPARGMAYRACADELAALRDAIAKELSHD